VSVRWLVLVLVLALLPAAELAEQGLHVVEHALAGDASDHDPHHGGLDPAEEHGCTGLVHVCGGQHGVGVAPTRLGAEVVASAVTSAGPLPPRDLRDLAAREPEYRPPIRSSVPRS
jgi:hypothetical protein